MRSRNTAAVGLACVTVLAGGAWLSAGPLNPPTGPVSAGGKTTQEIYDAVTGINGSIGAVGGRGPSVPGPSTTGGTIAVTGTVPFSGSIIGMRMGMATPYQASTGLATGPAALQTPGITVVRPISAGTTAAFRSEMQNVTATNVTITVPATGGNAVYVLTNVKVFGFRNYLVQRGDGTFGAIEEIDFVPQTIQITDPSGALFIWSGPGAP